jgi:hypothetical protein
MKNAMRPAINAPARRHPMATPATAPVDRPLLGLGVGLEVCDGVVEVGAWDVCAALLDNCDAPEVVVDCDVVVEEAMVELDTAVTWIGLVEMAGNGTVSPVK